MPNVFEVSRDEMRYSNRGREAYLTIAHFLRLYDLTHSADHNLFVASLYVIMEEAKPMQEAGTRHAHL